MEQQEREERTLLAPAERKRAAIQAYLEGAEDAELHAAQQTTVSKTLSRFLQGDGGMVAAPNSPIEEIDMRRCAVVVALAVASTLATTAAVAAGEQRFSQGRYTSPLTATDFTRYGGQMDPGFPHPWIITIRRGRWHTNENPAFGGSYVLRGNVITFVIKYPADAAGTRQKLRWTYSHGFLRFKIVSGVEGGDQAIYLAHPWRRLGP